MGRNKKKAASAKKNNIEKDGILPANNDAVTPIDRIPVYRWQLLRSLFSALLGAIFGLIPATVCAYIFKAPFYPLFIVVPLLIFLFNKLFRGSNRIFMFTVTAVFSLISAYITALTCQVAIVVSFLGITFFRIPALTVEAFGKPNVLPESASAYTYPLIFTALGIVVTCELICATQRRIATTTGDLKPEL